MCPVIYTAVQCQSWAAGMGTRVSMVSMPETTMLVVPSHRETWMVAWIARLRSLARHRAKSRGYRMAWTSPVSSSAEVL